MCGPFQCDRTPFIDRPDNNPKKIVSPKKVWMWQCSGPDWEGGVKVFLKGGKQRRGIVEKGGINILCKLS